MRHPLALPGPAGRKQRWWQGVERSLTQAEGLGAHKACSGSPPCCAAAPAPGMAAGPAPTANTVGLQHQPPSITQEHRPSPAPHSAAAPQQRGEACARLSEGTSASRLGTDPSSRRPWGSACAPGRDDRSGAHCPAATSGWPAGPVPRICPQAGARGWTGSDIQLKPCHYQPQAVPSCPHAVPDLEPWGLRDPTDAHRPGQQPGPSPSLLPAWLRPTPRAPGRGRGEAAAKLRDAAAPLASTPLSQALPEVPTPERGILRGPGYCRGNPRPRLKPHTERLPCLLSSGLQTSSATASLEHCPLSAAVSVLPRWDSVAHGVRTRTRPVMALLTSSVGPEGPARAPRLGLAAKSGKEGISDSRRSAAESGFQPSQNPTPRAAEQALSRHWALRTGCGEAQPSEQNPICQAAGTTPRHKSGSCRHGPAWLSSTRTRAQPSRTARGRSHKGRVVCAPLLSPLSVSPRYSLLTVEGSE